MKKTITSILFYLAIASVCFAQQAPQYSLYMWNKHVFNPAYAGMENSLSITGVYRSQWLNLPGSPETQTVNAHMPLYIAGGGVGISFENESIGSWKQSAATLSYNYQMLMGKSGVLSIGLSAGLIQRELDGAKIRTPEGEIIEGEYISHNDPLLPFLGVERGLAPTVGLGAFYQGEKLEVGLSAINLLENEVSLSKVTFKPERTYYLYLGYKLSLGRKLEILPSALLKSDVYQTQMDFSAIVRYNENISIGASFRGYDSNSQDAVAILAGIKLSEKINLGYAYDLTLSGLSNVSTGTHEILLNYNLGKPVGKGKPPIIIYNPRSL
ncbi:MAG TPA: type IX secretion system membrane protein PorP/SprF [Bacteroidetes bacterium]|nr:type IX secretion system membrane protein PorP/SprF [Bacteroidota bacterium]